MRAATESMPSIRCLVSGRVQGVGFRAATAREARRVGLSGVARNLPDGRVEVLARGEAWALAELARWLWQGPALARVGEVALEEAPADAEDCAEEGFSTA